MNANIHLSIDFPHDTSLKRFDKLTQTEAYTDFNRSIALPEMND